MVVSAWNPAQMHMMALPPCHWGFQVTVINGKLNLLWNQRSVDSALGLPFNIASYALLLKLLAAESNLEEGELIGFLGDTHIYQYHFNGLADQLQRDPFSLPWVQLRNFKSIYDWTHEDLDLLHYEHHPHIKFDIAV
jgi:thymidylate synthase